MLLTSANILLDSCFKVEEIRDSGDMQLTHELASACYNNICIALLLHTSTAMRSRNSRWRLSSPQSSTEADRKKQFPSLCTEQEQDSCLRRLETMFQLADLSDVDPLAAKTRLEGFSKVSNAFSTETATGRPGIFQ